MPAQVWSSTQVEIESARATAITIDGITNANPAVLTFTGTDPSNGDFVVVEDFDGMSEVVDRCVRVSGLVASTSFELENVNSTNFSAYGSGGTAAVITFGNSISTFTDVSASGGEPNFADATTIHTDRIVEIPTTTTPFEVAFTSQFDAASSALLALNTISDSKSKAATKITLSGGQIVSFYGYLTATLVPTGSAQELVTTNVTIKATGRVTAYAS